MNPIEQLTVGWEDPTQVDWGHVEEDSSIPAVIAAETNSGPTFKCTALYSYTVSVNFERNSESMRLIGTLFFRHKILMNLQLSRVNN